MVRVIGGWGGYVSLDHFVPRFVGVFIGEDGAILVNNARICRVLSIMSIWWVYPLDLLGVVLWCMHSTRIAQLSVLGSIRSSRGIVGSSYVMVSTLKCVMTCEFGKGPSWGLRLWYRFGYIVMSNVVVSRLFFCCKPNGGFFGLCFLYVGGHIHSLSIYVEMLFL